MKKFTAFLTILLAMVFAGVSAQTILFVKPGGNNNNDGTSWTNAKATLAGALNSVSNNAHIYMMVGTYSCADVAIPNGVTVTGGYASTSTGADTTTRLYPGTNANWNNATLCTILDGNNNSRVATVNSGGKLEGVIVRNGRVTGNGGGVLVNGGIVQHCVIINNSAIDEGDLSAKGGGVYIQNNGYLLNCVVAQNYANNGPGVAGTDGTLINNTITANYARTNCGTVTDYDGNVYGTVIIGEQCWMSENLRTTHFADGEVVNIVSGTTLYSSGYYGYYPNNNSANKTTYGLLYNWPAAVKGSSGSMYSNVRGICPTGWHLPSLQEWNQMKDYVAAQNAYLCGEGTDYIAKSLASTSYWTTYATSCTIGNQQNLNNTTGFDARPAGYLGNNYINFGNCVEYWSSTQYSSDYSYIFYLYYNQPIAYTSSLNRANGASVRCLRD